MKKLVGLFVLLGTALVAVGVWWMTHSGTLFTPTVTEPLKENQELGITKEAVQGKIILGTPAGIATVTLATGEISTLSGSLARLQDHIHSIQPSADNRYWLLRTTERVATTETKAPQHTYLIDWQQNSLRRLDETFAQQVSVAQSTLTAAIWGENGILGLAFNTETGSADTENTATHLAAFAPADTKFQDFGVVRANSIQLLGYDLTANQLFISYSENGGAKIGAKKYSSNQLFELIPDAAAYFSGNSLQNKQVALSSTEVMIQQLPQLETAATIELENGYVPEPALSWASSGEVLAVVWYSEQDINTKLITYYSSSGSKLYEFSVTGSAVVQLSADGQASTVTVTPAQTEDTTEAVSPTYYYVHVFEGRHEVFSNIPAQSTVLGVF